jgi:type IV secretory pathway TrbF-like protein
LSSTSLTPIQKAAYQEYEYLGSTLTTNTALKVVVVILSCVIGVLCWQLVHVSRELVAQKPIVIRVNDVGRAEAVNYPYSNYTPQDPEIRYFATQFVTNYYSRNHKTIRNDYPNSLYFLDDNLSTQIDNADRQTQWAAKFLASTDDDIDVNVRNVALSQDNPKKEEYRARIDFQKTYTSAAGSETKREDYVCNLYFSINPSLVSKNNNLVKHNPLGFLISSFRADQAFENTSPQK